jgi:hypothetical protein
MRPFIASGDDVLPIKRTGPEYPARKCCLKGLRPDVELQAGSEHHRDDGLPFPRALRVSACLRPRAVMRIRGLAARSD